MKWRIVVGAALATAAAVLGARGNDKTSADHSRALNLAAAAAAPAPNGSPPAAVSAAAAGGAEKGGGQQAHDSGNHGDSSGGNGSNNNSGGGGGGGAQAPAKEGERTQQGSAPQHNQQQHGEPAAKHEASGTKNHAPTATNKGSNDGGKNDKKGGKDNGKHSDEKKEPTKTRKGSSKNKDDDDESDDEAGDDEAEKEYLKRVKADKDAGRMPGRMKMLVPPRTVHTPLFELDSVIELQWEYDNNVIEVPEKLMISVQLPKDPHAAPGTKPMIYDIAVNVTGDQKKFFWDTKNDVPEGEGMREGSGYTMYFYDGDIGFRMSDVVPAGYLIKYAMPFAFYISRYERTNDGVPRNYNPNSAARHGPALGAAALCSLVAVALAQLL
ncbi:hypothetical protein GGI23_005891 [Coemansia sp. RSA 2559]|nr:hypothetical protein GGI23_005891 [Coemansia sp. RSA 2559]KAJ2855905.1 hypothetical protein GGI22_003977 [Coemansia erecta]